MKLIILGCGSSLGSPWITNHWGNCDIKNKYNKRTRCSVYIQKGNLSVLIDTSPDIKEQFLKNNIKLKKNYKILDIGCGRAYIIDHLYKKYKFNQKPFGIDIIKHRDISKKIRFKKIGLNSS